MAKLFVLSGDDVGKTFEVVGDQAVLGRGKDCDMVVRGLSISRRHARVERAGTGWRLVDLGSSNGIRLSGMKVTEGELVSGETFHLGEVELRFRSEDEISAPIQPQVVEPLKPIPIPEEPVVPLQEPAPAVEEEFDLEGDWDADAPVEVQPIHSAPKPRPEVRTPATPVQPKADKAERRAEALGGTRSSGPQTQTGGSRPLQYQKVENRSGMLGADLDQQGSTTRFLIYAVVVALFAALAYGAYNFTAASKRATAAQEAE